MTLTVQRSALVLDEKFDEYHIRIVGASSRMCTERYSRQKIDAFLTDLFDSDSDGAELEEAPLESGRHAFSEDISNASRNILLVELRLTGHAQEANITLDEAAERFCQLIFDPKVRGALSTLTPNGLLGISAVSGSFKQYWTRTVFRDCMKNGPRLLKRIDTDFHDNSLPEWALALSFAVVAGLNFEVFADAMSSSFDPIEVFGTIGVTLGSSILKKYTRKDKQEIAEQEQMWTRCHTELLSSIDTISEVLEEVTDPATLGANSLRQHNDLCDALYEATLIAAKTFTSNQDIFDAFVKLRSEAAFDATSAGLAAVVALTHFGSAFTLVTTSQALPLASWCLADAAAFLTGGGAPLMYSTTLCVAWPLAIAAAGFSTFFGVKGYLNLRERQKFKKRMDYHTKMNAVIGRAWGLAHDIHTFLLWIHLTDASVPEAVDFVDNRARSEWEQFIRSVRAATGGNATRADLGPQMVLAYLSEQSRSWFQLREALGDE